jgi:hypothetical protein
MRFSRVLAVLFGILAPVGETIRRWDTWQEFPPALFDDYLMGALLIWGAWSTRGGYMAGIPVLTAAWGFTCGLGYYSFFEQVRRYLLGEVDPAPIPSGWIVAIKGGGLALAVLALILTLREGRSNEESSSH